MRKNVLMIGLVIFLIVSPSSAYSQQYSKKPKKELKCGCEINDIDRKCGKCGGFLVSHLNRILNNSNAAFDYKCRDCSHEHIALSNEYYWGHVCNKERCLEWSTTKDSEENRTFHFRNVCPQKIPFILWIYSENSKTRSLLTPGADWTPNIKYPKKAEVRIEIDSRSERNR